MNINKPVRCKLCGKRLKKGGDNYRLECMVVSDFDGYINLSAKQSDIRELIDDIEHSKLTEQELNEQVYFELKGKLCLDCRNKVINFLKEQK
ncbi:MAG: hypothetical protein J7K40_04230 [candidate division Zixibacteria bacterium]|nr:hypothetical protein [candidate division Zixibacteria bacterium]